jgi:hypothetical protein
VPVAPIGWLLPRYDHQVTETWRDLLLTARAEVSLASLERVQEANVEIRLALGFGLSAAAGPTAHAPSPSLTPGRSRPGSTVRLTL